MTAGGLRSGTIARTIASLALLVVTGRQGESKTEDDSKMIAVPRREAPGILPNNDAEASCYGCLGGLVV
jgi:hypothetical protein